MTTQEKNTLETAAYQMRRDVVEMLTRSGVGGHYGPSLSCAEIIACLYFQQMRVDPHRPQWDERDRFVISKGHGALVVYAALARKGFFPVEELWRVKQIDSFLQGHPDMNKTPGIDATSGSLGNGISFGLGLALGYLRAGNPGHVYVLLGDGESQEGIVWEAVMLAAAQKVDNLTVILDYNHMQGSGPLEEVIPLEPLRAKWESFGWHVLDTNGHDVEEISSRLEMARQFRGNPTVVVAHTVKGKGVSFMEHNNKWHSTGITDEEYAAAIAELDRRLLELREGGRA